jgi:hypothetical protein
MRGEWPGIKLADRSTIASSVTINIHRNVVAKRIDRVLGLQEPIQAQAEIG